MNQSASIPANGTPASKTAARIGIGGPVGSGKTALIERLIPALTARGPIAFQGLRHAVLEAADADRPFRANDAWLALDASLHVVTVRVLRACACWVGGGWSVDACFITRSSDPPSCPSHLAPRAPT